MHRCRDAGVQHITGTRPAHSRPSIEIHITLPKLVMRAADVALLHGVQIITLLVLHFLHGESVLCKLSGRQIRLRMPSLKPQIFLLPRLWRSRGATQSLHREVPHETTRSFMRFRFDRFQMRRVFLE